MLNSLLTRVFGSRNERLLRQLQRSVAKINALEPQMEKLTDAELQAKTAEFQKRIADGESLDKLLPEAFAVCREASRRVLGMRHYDVQLIGGMVLHLGKIAEMRTGEGKTLVATLPVYLNALEGKGVHVVTVNDYLARRDSAWMGRVYNWLGLSVGVVYPGMPHGDKHAAYAADITYGTNNEFGFDYLRDNMALSKEDRFQRGLNYAIVDEVDSILIDEARTPLIISGPADESPELYIKVNRIVPSLTRQTTEDGEGDYWVDEKSKQVHLSESGQEHAEALLRQAGILQGDDDALYGAQNLGVVHHLNAALRAHAIYQRDVDYIVRDGEVVIVDEFTGRTLAGPALVRRPAPGGRGEGRRAGPAREPDAGEHHLPEPVPHVQQAVRHDRHGRHRGLRVPEHLRPGSDRDPDAPAGGCARTIPMRCSSTAPASTARW